MKWKKIYFKENTLGSYIIRIMNSSNSNSSDFSLFLFWGWWKNKKTPKSYQACTELFHTCQHWPSLDRPAPNCFIPANTGPGQACTELFHTCQHQPLTALHTCEKTGHYWLAFGMKMWAQNQAGWLATFSLACRWFESGMIRLCKVGLILVCDRQVVVVPIFILET